MQIIFVKENQKDEWDEFIASNPNGSFLQSWAWGDFQKSFGRKIWRLAAMENNEIMSATLIIKHSLPFGWNYFYCPRPILETKNKFLIFEEVKKMAEKEKVVFLRIDPSFVIPAPACNAVATAGRKARIYDNKKYNLEKWIPACAGMTEERKGMTKQRITITKDEFPMIKKTKPTQPQHTLILDITKSEEEILSQMKQKTRYNIRLAERKGVKIKKISRPNNQEIQTFLNLSAQTSKRDKFQIHPKEYYQKMLKILCQNSMAKLFLAEYQNEIIAANIVIFFSGKAIYSHGASSSNHREAMAPYLLHWEQIKEAKKLECQSYDFWGIDFSKSKIQNSKSQINSKFKTQNSKLNNWVGITRFKKGFGGEEISYLESYDVILKPILYWVYKIGKKII